MGGGGGGGGVVGAVGVLFQHCKRILCPIDTKMLCHSHMPKGLSTHRRQGKGIYYASRDTHVPQFGQGLMHHPCPNWFIFSNHQHLY